jgi:TatA/E family protein of Tat protein translocase
MFGIGMQELAIIFVVALLIFGPKRLPELARTLGKGLAEFRRASTDLRQSFDLSADEPSSPASSTPRPDSNAGDPREQRELDSLPQQVVGDMGSDLGDDMGHDAGDEAQPPAETAEADSDAVAEPQASDSGTTR